MNKAKYETDGLLLTRGLLDFVGASMVRETEAQATLRAATGERSNARMMISPEQGNVLEWLFRLTQPRRLIEVGVFTGYSATWLAQALEPGGVLVACELDEDYLAGARAAWKAAGIADRIVGRQGPAAATLEELLDAGWADSVDGIFVDADKTGYDTYYELGLRLLRPGGVMLFDNILWSGAVADVTVSDPSTEALRSLALKAGQDPRVHATILTDGDGILAVSKPHPRRP